MGSRLTFNTCNMIKHSCPWAIRSTIPLVPHNSACVKWCHNMTTEGNRHIENCENTTHKWVADDKIAVEHVCGKFNIANIFTKEMRNGGNCCRLCNSFMCRAGNFLRSAHNVARSSPSFPLSDTSVLAQSVTYVCPSCPGILDVLINNPSLCLASMLTSISSTGCHILSRLAPSSYMQLLLSNLMGVLVRRLLITSYCLLDVET